MPSCGTYSSYTHGCRCPECRAAAATYQAERRAAKRRLQAVSYRALAAVVLELHDRLATGQPWRAQAACLGEDTATFYPTTSGKQKQAMAICDSCPVQAECLTEALAHADQYGVWGGRSERARRAMRRMNRTSTPPNP